MACTFLCLEGAVLLHNVLLIEWSGMKRPKHHIKCWSALLLIGLMDRHYGIDLIGQQAQAISVVYISLDVQPQPTLISQQLFLFRQLVPNTECQMSS